MPSIGLSMIVKNGGDDLRHCLNSVRSLVDQIVIADTGSTDHSIEIAREFGAEIFSIPWTGHFAEARNAALAPMTTDWVLVLDADEELSPEAAKALPGLLARTPEKVAGYQLTIRNYTNEAFARIIGSLGRKNTDTYERAKSAQSYCEHLNCRIFLRHPSINFIGRIHEGVEHQIYNQGFLYLPSELLILHYGTLAEKSVYAEKQERYYKMLREAVEENPNFHHLWLQLAVTERSTRKDPDAAVECARRALALHPHEYEAWELIAEIMGEKGNHQEAIEALQHLPDTGDWGITKGWSLGDHLHDLGRFKEARTMYSHTLERARKNPNPLPKEFLKAVESRLGYAEVRIGMKKVGFRKLIEARDTAPMTLANHERLMKAYVSVQDDRGAAEAAETALQYWSSEQLYGRAAALYLRVQETKKAQNLIEAGILKFPDSLYLRRLAG